MSTQFLICTPLDVQLARREAARAAVSRLLPCPTCDAPRRLTPDEVARGYHCTRCADADEGCF